MVSELLSGAGAAVLVGPLAVWLGKVWAARILERDRVRYQTQMETLLQELRTRSSKELYVHQLQFETEFRVYLDLWKDVVALDQAASEFREMKISSSKPLEEQRADFMQAHNRLRERVDKQRPFYAPDVWESARVILKKSANVFLLHSMNEPSEVPWTQTEKLLEEVVEAIESLCNSIRSRIWVDRFE